MVPIISFYCRLHTRSQRVIRRGNLPLVMSQRGADASLRLRTNTRSQLLLPFSRSSVFFFFCSFQTCFKFQQSFSCRTEVRHTRVLAAGCKQRANYTAAFSPLYVFLCCTYSSETLHCPTSPT